MPTRVLVTGGAGFIGANFIEYALQTHPDWHITNLDKLTYAGFLENVQPFQAVFADRYHFVHGDVCDGPLVLQLVAESDLIVHFAAESNVDLSIGDAVAFLDTNIYGTRNLLEACRQHPVQRLLVVSTDEVYGNAWQDRPSLESDPLMPCSPYAASKAAQDVLAFSYFETYGLPVVRTRCSNNYGPRQDPTKLIPRFLLHALHDQPLPIYGHGHNTRDWIYVQDHCRAIDAVLHAPDSVHGQVFNVGADSEHSVLTISDLILDALHKPTTLMSHVPDRLGHVRRHAVNSELLQRTLGWHPEMTFEAGIAQTIAWYQQNPDWWQAVVKAQSQRLPNYAAVYQFPAWFKSV
jgi:dTDP-glucose 4,6-dehydratase